MTELIRPPRLYHKQCGKKIPYGMVSCPGEIYVIAVLNDQLILVCDICDRGAYQSACK